MLGAIGRSGHARGARPSPPGRSARAAGRVWPRHQPRLLAAGILAAVVAGWGAAASAQAAEPTGATPAAEVGFVTGQYAFALRETTQMVQEAYRDLSATSGRTIARRLWERIGLGSTAATISAVYAATYRSQLLPALAESSIGLAAVTGASPALAARVRALVAFDRRLAGGLRGLTAVTEAEPAFVGRLDALLRDGLPLEGASLTIPVAPDAGAVRPTAAAASRPVREDVSGGYTAQLDPLGPRRPVRVSLVVPTVRCPRGRARPVLQVGVQLSGWTAAAAAVQSLVVVACSGGRATVSSSVALPAGRAIHPGDHVTLTVVPGARRSQVSLDDTTRAVRRSQAAVGIAPDAASVGVEAALAATISVQPGTAPGQTGPGTISAGYLGVPRFSPVVFTACTIGPAPLSAFAPAGDDLTTAAGRQEVATGRLVGGRFAMTFVG